MMTLLTTTDVTAQSSKLYSLNDLIAVALESNPQVLAARERANAVKSQLSTAQAIPNPEFEIASGQQRSVIGATSPGNVSTWSFTQPVDMPYMRSPRIEAAEANLRSALATKIAFEVETIAKVQNSFYELMRREAEANAGLEDFNLTKQIRDRVQVRYDVGEISRFDVIRAQTELLNAQIIVESSKLRLGQARSQLRQAVGHGLPPSYEVVTTPLVIEDLPPLQNLITEANAQSPELQRARADIEASESKLVFEKNSRLPRFALKATQTNDPSFTDRLYGLQITIPIWDRKKGLIGEAQANALRAKHQLEAQSQNLEEQLNIAHGLYQITSFQVKVLDQEVVKLASSAQRIAEISYRYGERSMLEYLDAQRTFRVARNDLIRAKFDLAAVVTEIQRLRAKPEWLVNIESTK